MNEQDFATLVDRAAAALEPDVDALVAGGATRGRRALRRRRTVAALGATGAVAALATVAALLPGAGTTPSAPDRSPGFADSSTAPTPTQQRRELAAADVVAARLAAQLSGTVTDLQHEQWGGERPSLQVSLLLDGAVVTAYVNDAAPTDPATIPPPGPKPAGCDPSEIPGHDGTTSIDEMEGVGERVLEDPAFAACFEWVSDRAEYDCAQDPDCWGSIQWGDNPCATEPSVREDCTRRDDGGWAWSGQQPTYGAEGPGHPTDLAEAFGRVYTGDYWEIQLTALNSAGEKEGPALHPAPVLSPAELAELAASEIWFRQR